MDTSKILDTVIKFLTKFLAKEVPAEKQLIVVSEAPKETLAIAKPSEGLVVDWNDPASKISKHFTVKEATYLNSWHVFHKPTDDQKTAILEIANDMDVICEILEKSLQKAVSVNVHAWMRPDKAICPGTPYDGQDYNKWIYWNQVWTSLTLAQKAEKHVPMSPHRTGHAVDFHIVGFEGAEGCAKIRQLVLPHLEEIGLRMEDITGGWVHLDNLPAVHQRFFKP